MVRFVIAGDDRDEQEEPSDSESESEVEEQSEEEADESEAEEAAGEEEADGAGPSTAAAPSPGSTIKQRKLNIKLGAGADVCHVCGQRGHTAGFVGAKYLDCPNKPCYLCGKQGHSTMTCPYRVAPGHGCTQAAGVSNDTMLTALRKREQGGRPPPLQAPTPARWQVDAAVLKLFHRRVTCLEFHPTQDNLVLSADKSGHIAVWDWQKVYERTVYDHINRWLTSGLRFMPGGDGSSCASASYDGTVKIFDIETGAHSTVFNANPQGWDSPDTDEGSWVYLLGMDVIPAAGAMVAGDSFGCLHFLDARMSRPIASMQLHKKNTKVQCVHSNPSDSNLLISAGNDYVARVLDIRNLIAGNSVDSKGKAAAGSSSAPPPAELAQLQHHKVINSAYFSPLTGRKILTTSQDNRLRVWDYLYATQQPADREIVHSQNFNRYLTPFRAEWDPKDPSERLIVCGRYISEDFGGLALHPVDLLDASTGALVGELTDPNLSTICPVNKPHPRLDVIVSGSSRSLYAWQPSPEEEEEDEEGGGSSRQRRGGGGGGGGGGDGGLPFNLKGSANFIFFDADPDADKKKKGGARGKAATATATASPCTAATSGSAAAAAAAAGGQESPGSGGKPAGGKGKGRGGKVKGKGAAAAAAEAAAAAATAEAGEEDAGTSKGRGRKGGSSRAGGGGAKGKRKRQEEEAEEGSDDDE